MLKRYYNLVKNVKNWYKYFSIKKNPQKFFLLKGRHQVGLWLIKEISPIFKEIYMENIYQIELIKLYVRGSSPVIVDIGANAGYAATFFFSHFPKARVISFEPLPTNFELLSKNQKQNAFLNWEVICKAVGKGNGTISLFFQKSKGLTPVSSIYADFDKNNQDCLEVEMISLPQIFQDFGLSKIDLFKLDCEGAEYEILYHTPQEYFNRISCLLMETHYRNDKNENKEALANFLQSVGFQTKILKEMLWAWRK
jgi:FkbM family methyltransferase